MEIVEVVVVVAVVAAAPQIAAIRTVAK